MKYRTGVTRDDIVAVALDLTRAHGLYGWSVRDLLRVLGTANSVVYSKVGGKDALCEAVVESIFTNGDLVVARSDVPWKQWFLTTLMAIRDELVPYPGVAKWLTLHGGPRFPGVLGRLHVGVVKLRDAGFGDSAVAVFAALMVTAMNTITMTDERIAREGDGRRDHAHIVDALRRVSANDAAAEDFLAFSAQFDVAPGEADARRRDFYHLVVSSMIDGMGARLRAGG